MSFKKEFKADVNDKVYSLDQNGNPVEDTVVAVDYKKVLENGKPKETLEYVLKSDINAHVDPVSFYTSKEGLKKAIDSKFKEIKVNN